MKRILPYVRFTGKPAGRRPTSWTEAIGLVLLRQIAKDIGLIIEQLLRPPDWAAANTRQSPGSADLRAEQAKGKTLWPPYFRPNGRAIDKLGVTPDTILEQAGLTSASFGKAKDLQLMQALSSVVRQQ